MNNTKINKFLIRDKGSNAKINELLDALAIFAKVFKNSMKCDYDRVEAMDIPLEEKTHYYKTLDMETRTLTHNMIVRDFKEAYMICKKYNRI